MSMFCRCLPILLLAMAITACNRNTAPGNDRSAATAEPAPPAMVVEASKAVSEADKHGIEPSTMATADFAQVVGDTPACRFQLTAVGLPVFAATGRDGAIKINGKVVKLQSPGANPAQGLKITMTAGDIDVSITPLEEEGERLEEGVYQREANLVFDLKGGRKVGYRGYYICRD